MNAQIKILALIISAFSICRFAFSSSYFLEDADTEIEIAGIFFDGFQSAFSRIMADHLETIRKMPYIAHLESSIQSFPVIARDQLFSQVMGNSKNPETYYDEFLILFESFIGNEMDLIKAHRISEGDNEIGYQILEISSIFKDSIMISVKTANETISEIRQVNAEAQNDYYQAEDYFFDPQNDHQQPRNGTLESQNTHQTKDSIFASDFDFFLGDIPEHDSGVTGFNSNCFDDEEVKSILTGPAKKEDLNFDSQEENEAEIWAEILRDSPRPLSPAASPELLITATAAINYGIYRGSPLFLIAYSYLNFVDQVGLGTAFLDPIRVFAPEIREKAFSFGFDVDSPIFQDFCNFVSINNMPAISMLYKGPKISKNLKLELKRSILLQIAFDDMRRILEKMNVSEMTELILSNLTETGSEIIEMIVERVRDELSVLTLSLKFKGSLSCTIESEIKRICSEIFEPFSAENSDQITEQVLVQFTELFRSPIALLSKSDNVILWGHHYSIDSSFSSNNSQTSSPSRRSVTIVEGNNVQFDISRIDDILEEFDGVKAKTSLERISSITRNLRELELEDPNRHHEIRPIVPNDERSALDDDNFLFDLSVFDSVTVVPATTNAPPSVHPPTNKRFAQDEIPDFPFEDPIQVVYNPGYIVDTVDYYEEQGDNSCFMLNERLETMKEGVEIMLRGSFADSVVVENIGNIIKNALNSIFEN